MKSLRKTQSFCLWFPNFEKGKWHHIYHSLGRYYSFVDIFCYTICMLQQTEKRKFRSWESGNGQSCTFLLCSGFPRPGCNIRACVMRHNCSINTFKCKRYEPNEKGVTLVGSNKIKETLEKPVERSIRFTPLPCDQTLTSKHRPKTWDGRLRRLWFEVMAFTFTWMHLADACIQRDLQEEI